MTIAGPGATCSSLAVAVGACWLVFSLTLGGAYILLPPNPDQAIFDYIGWVITEGGSLYTDVAEQNFPGKMWLHSLSTWLFGNHTWSYRLLDYLLLLATCGVLYLLLSTAGGGRESLIVVPLYQVLYVTAGPWMSGTRDAVGAHFLLAAGYCLYLRVFEKRPSWWLIPFSGLNAFAILIRPTYALFAPLLALLFVVYTIRKKNPWYGSLRDSIIGLGATGVLLGAVFLLGLYTGQTQEWYRLTVLYNLNVYSHSASTLDVARTMIGLVSALHWPIAYATCGAWLWYAAESGRPALAIVVSLVVTVIVSAYVQLKGFGYHFAGLLPAIALLCAYFIGWVVLAARASSASRSVLRAALALVIVVLAGGGLAKKLVGQLGGQFSRMLGAVSTSEMLAANDYLDVVEVSRLVGRSTGEDETVLVWSRKLHVNFLAERRSPTRFITVWMLNEVPDSFSLGQGWIDEFERDFTTHDPALVVLDAADDRVRENPTALATNSRVFSFLLRQLGERYRLETTIGSLDVYRRVP